MNRPQPCIDALSETEKLDWLRLFRSENVGPITFYRLLERYGSAGKALEALPDLAKRGGRQAPLRLAPLQMIEREYQHLQKMGGGLLTAACPDYPLGLSACDDAPPVLSYFGNPQLAQQNCIAMVGARNASLNGRKFAEKLSKDLGAREQIIVSGLARGIDTSAHQGALATGTIAVIAGGLDVIYPEENVEIYHQIREQGLILAESPLGQKPFAQSFPKRNRIVSGLSKAVIVVEATMRSGSLITARLAGEQGRDVMAMPGHPMDPRAAGPNHLIREGATLVRNAEDVMETLLDYSGRAMREPFHEPADFTPPSIREELKEPPENAQENVLNQLSLTPIAVDELLRACEVSIPVMQTILLELELAGRIKRLPGGRVSLNAEDLNAEE